MVLRDNVSVYVEKDHSQWGAKNPHSQRAGCKCYGLPRLFDLHGWLVRECSRDYRERMFSGELALLRIPNAHHIGRQRQHAHARGTGHEFNAIGQDFD